jgi:DNA polymerase III epsilon subunit-like protein
MANEYHDELGRFCSRDRMRVALRHAIETGNAGLWIKLKEDMTKADASSNYLPSKRNGLIHPAVANKEADIAQRDAILESGTTEEIKQWVNNRVNNENFIDLLDERDVMKERARMLNQEYKMLEEQSKAGKVRFELVRKKGFESQEAYEEFMVLKNQANDYKDITALAAARLSEKTVEDETEAGTFREYTDSTLNNLVETGEFPSGSREWLEQRQKGIGGSDVGKIVGVSDDTGRNTAEYNEILTSKLDPISDEQVEVQADGHISYTGYAGRGNAWEMTIAQRFAENNPEANLTHCKSSWKNSEHEYQFANFDGLMTDENGKPNGILEIKTASDASKWGDTSLGLDGVPKGYRAQTLWYADAAGFNKGAVAVLIDDREYREYHFTVTPELREEMNSNRAKVEEFVARVDSIKKGKEVDPRIPKNISGRKAFSPTMLTAARRGHDVVFQEAAILREETVEQTKARFNELRGDSVDEDVLRSSMQKLYTEKPLSERKKKFVHIDLETSGTQPTAGHIIEVGISVRSPQGGEVDKQAKLYGLTRRALAAQSTGATEVHGITEGKIAKKRSFQHAEEQKKLLKTLKSGIMVAHNAPFEKRWLSQHLDGFAEALRKGQIQILDTKSLTTRMVTSTPNAKLSSFCEEFGIKYENAHRAYNDAEMMGRGLDGLLSKWDNERQ